MEVSIAASVWVTAGITLLAWLFVRFGMMLPAQRELFNGLPEKLADDAMFLGTLQIFEAFLRSALIALVALMGIAFLLNQYAGSLPSTESGLTSLVAARDVIDSLFGWATALSWWVWLIALTILAAIFLFVTMMGAGRRWEKAIEARQLAVDTAIDGLSDEDLERMAAEEVPEANQALLESRDALKLQNAEAREEALNRPIITLQDEGNARVSYLEFVTFIDELRKQAGELREAGDSAAARDKRELAEVYSEQVSQVAAQVRYNTSSLNHADTRTLADDGADIYEWDAEIAGLRRKALKENRLAMHAEMGEIQRRSEPEIWHEYVGTVLTGEATVKSVGWIGRNMRMIALVTFFVGFFSFGASVQGAEFSNAAADREVEMVLAIGDQELDAAIASGSSTASASVDDASLASDAATEIRLRRAMRSNLARSLMQGVVQGGDKVALNALQDAGLRGIGTRESLLQNAARDGAPELGDPSQRRSKIMAEMPEAGRASSSVDEIFDRRIAQLREDPNVWRKLRASAARPARGGLISNQLLAATLGDNDFTRSQDFLKAADRSTAQFAKSVAETGDIPRNLDNLVPSMHNPALFSNQGKRQFADFQRTVGDRVDSRLRDVRSGKSSVGSLFRAVPDIKGSGMRRSGSGSYSDTFPSKNRGSRFGFAEGISNKAADVSRRPGFSGSGGRSGGGGRGPRIRRKGVVLGANPVNPEAFVPLESFSWSVQGDNVSFVLKPEGAGEVRLGSFDRETVNTALAFAADGRPDLATMPEMFFVQGDPVLDGMNDFTPRIVLHPAIQDTDLACNAIWLDRFIDLSMRLDAGISGQSTLLDGWLANRELAVSQGEIEPGTALSRHVQSCGTGGDCFPIESYSGQGLDLSYYSNPLTCLANGGEGCSTFPGQAANAYNMTSIVEEVPYDLAPDLGFLTGGDNAGALWPFEFKMRAVPLARIEGQQLSLPDDFKAWDFPGAQAEIDRVVSENLTFEPGARQIHRRMRDFTVLQRMFKTALDGRFGAAFPYDELVKLQAATSNAVTTVRTGHWDLYNVYDRRQERFAYHMNSMAAQLVPTLEILAEEGAPSCAQAASRALSGQRSRPLPGGAGLWPDINDVVAKCSGELSNSSITMRARNRGSVEDDLAAIELGRTPMSRLGFREIVNGANEQDLISDAMMLSRGEFNVPFFGCPAR